MSLSEQVYKPLLTVKSYAAAVSDTALITYYTRSPYHLKRLEEEVARLESALEGLRLALAAPRSRDEDPLADVEAVR